MKGFIVSIRTTRTASNNENIHKHVFIRTCGRKEICKLPPKGELDWWGIAISEAKDNG